MIREELLQAISFTSGFCGLEEFEYYEAHNNINKFIEWYKEDISFCTQEGKELGAKVIASLLA